jgi:hypothetical protein
MFWDCASKTPAQHSERSWRSDRLFVTDNTLILVAHTPNHFKLFLTALFIADLLGAFLHSSFTQNLCKILKTLAVL